MIIIVSTLLLVSCRPISWPLAAGPADGDPRKSVTMRTRALIAIIGIILTGAAAALAQTLTSFEYDSLGRLIAVDRTDSSSVEYTYDAAGNRAAVSSEGGGGGATGSGACAILVVPLSGLTVIPTGSCGS